MKPLLLASLLLALLALRLSLATSAIEADAVAAAIKVVGFAIINKRLAIG